MKTEILEANNNECMTVIKALQKIDGRVDENGELTSLGMLVFSIIDEILVTKVAQCCSPYEQKKGTQ